MTAVDDASTSAALASPARRRVLDAVRAAAEPPTAQQLAADLDLHVTTVRFHLDQLEQLRLVQRTTGQDKRRGRPSVHYRAAGLEADAARDQMIEALAEALAASGAAARRESDAAGRRWADTLPVPQGRPEAAIAEAFGRLGFDPEPAGDEIRLRACPFREAAARYPQVVCQVHSGLAERIAEQAAGRAVNVRLRPFVEPGLCVLTLAPQAAATQGAPHAD